MSAPRASPHDRHQTARYDIRVKGHLAARWATWFGAARLIHEQDGITRIRVPAVDQAALHGLLQKVRDMGLPLVAVTCIDHDPPDAPTSEPQERPTRHTRSVT